MDILWINSMPFLLFRNCGTTMMSRLMWKSKSTRDVRLVRSVRFCIIWQFPHNTALFRDFRTILHFFCDFCTKLHQKGIQLRVRRDITGCFITNHAHLEFDTASLDLIRLPDVIWDTSTESIQLSMRCNMYNIYSDPLTRYRIWLSMLTKCVVCVTICQ